MTGYGVIRIEEQQIQLLAMGALLLSEAYRPSETFDFKKLESSRETYLPDECAIEAPFFGKNVQSMLKQERLKRCVWPGYGKRHPCGRVFPRKVKQAITGNGNASKEQVAAMVKQICG